jgi:short-subunit dehydrogenase
MKILKSMLVIACCISFAIQASDQHKVALITGVSRGIGHELAQNLLDRGIHVIGISRSDASAVKDLCVHQNFSYICVDLTTSDGISTVQNYIDEHDCTFDFVVHNAGMMMPPQNLDVMDLKTMEDVIQLNLMVPMKLSSIAIPHCNSGARILNVTSRAATTIVPQVGPYCISKAGLNMLTGILQKELTSCKIAVASVIPGEVDTEIQNVLREAPEFTLKEKFRENYADEKLVSPRMCAQFLAWLLCDCAYDDFNRADYVWEIYDTSHHAQWLTGTLPAFPF